MGFINKLKEDLKQSMEKERQESERRKQLGLLPKYRTSLDHLKGCPLIPENKSCVITSTNDYLDITFGLKNIKIDYKNISNIILNSDRISVWGEYENKTYIADFKGRTTVKDYGKIKERYDNYTIRYKKERIEKQRLECEQKQKEIHESRERTKNNPDEYKRLNKMCEDIEKEIKNLFNKYNKMDLEYDLPDMIDILCECERKANVMDSTIEYHDCYNLKSLMDIKEEIERKEKSLIRSYIQNEKDKYYYIDLSFFSDLKFSSLYQWEQSEKLEKYNDSLY